MSAKYPASRTFPYNAIVRFNPLTQALLIFHRATEHTTVFIIILVFVLLLSTGRMFCGWMCPVGAGLDIINKLFGRYLRKRGRDICTPTLSWKYRILILTGILLFSGVSLYWFIDPTSMFTRNTALIIYPVIDTISRSITKVLSELPVVGYPIEKAMRATFNPLPVKSVYLWLFLIILLGIFSLETVARRYFCKVLCPFGALLGWWANISPFRLRVQNHACTRCRACVSVCKTHAMEIVDNEIKIDPTECILCLACREVCPQSGLDVLIKVPEFLIHKTSFQKTRRDFVFGIVGAAVLLPLYKFIDDNIPRPKHLIRPPGAIPEERFSQVCAKCGSCMKICYTSGLQPVMLEYGADNLFTPNMVNTIGFCGYECNACGKICPTGAITYMPLEKKRKALMGLAQIDHTICWPWSEKKPCLTCEEVCPIPQKAIEFEERPVTFDDGTAGVIQLPHVVIENCIGCGICENNCPARPIRAIKVTFANETRGGKIRTTPPRERRTGFTTDEKTYWKG
jgi:ferredoxin